MLNITTLTGLRLDLDPKQTIEVNMGGISLMNLESRTVTYTNSFKAPRTPNNEQIFELASLPTRNNKPKVDVIISNGLFNKKAVLKLTTVGKEYNCTVSYSSLLDNIKGQTYEKVYNDLVLLEAKTDEYLIDQFALNGGFYGTKFLLTYNSDLRIPSSKDELPNSLSAPASDVLTRIGNSYGVHFKGTLLADTDFQNTYITLPSLYILKDEFHIDTRYVTRIEDSKILITDLIKEICLLHFADMAIKDDGIYLNKLDLSAAGIAIEGFDVAPEKQIYSGLAANNTISYTVADAYADKNVFGDVVIGDGDGTKELVTLKSYLPAQYGGLMDIRNDSSVNGKIILSTLGYQPTTGGTFKYKSSTRAYPAGTTTEHVLTCFAISGFYSDTLTPIFQNAVILDAEKIIDPLTANNIMESRIIKSVQLGGRYWVDKFAYNLTTGKSKLTLIKLP